MGFDAYHVLFALSVFVLAGIPVMMALFFFGARRAVRMHDPVDPTLLASRKEWPAVSIMKPCSGGDDDLEGCLESYARVNYPKFEIVLSIANEKDQAFPIVKRFKEKHPELDISYILTNNGRQLSPKVSNLECISHHVKYDVMWQSDSNTRVHPDTLASMVIDLESGPDVGIVVSPLMGDGEQTPGSALESLQMTMYIGLYAFVIHALTRRLTSAGKSAVVRRETLERVGGWASVGQYAGDDYILFEKIRALGLKLILGRHLVANVSQSAPVQKFIARHLRWMGIRWRVGPLVALIEPLSSPMVPTAALLLWSPSYLSLALFAAAMLEQLVADMLVMYVQRGRHMELRFLPLIFLRPFITVYFWARGVFPLRVDWRGHQMWLGAQGAIMLESPMRTRLRSMRDALRATGA